MSRAVAAERALPPPACPCQISSIVCSWRAAVPLLTWNNRLPAHPLSVPVTVTAFCLKHAGVNNLVSSHSPPVQTTLCVRLSRQGEVITHLTALVFVINRQLAGDVKSYQPFPWHINGIKRLPVTLLHPLCCLIHSAGNRLTQCRLPALPVSVEERPLTLFCVVYCPWLRRLTAAPAADRPKMVGRVWQHWTYGCH